MVPPESLAKRQAKMRAAQASRPRRGRPRLPLDPVAIFELALLGLSNRQIARQLGCDHKTLRRRFACDLARARLRRRTLLQVEQVGLIAEEDSWAALQAQLKQCAGKSPIRGR